MKIWVHVHINFNMKIESYVLLFDFVVNDRRIVAMHAGFLFSSSYILIILLFFTASLLQKAQIYFLDGVCRKTRRLVATNSLVLSLI